MHANPRRSRNHILPAFVLLPALLVRVLLACVKVTGRGVPPVLALVADRRFFVRAV